MLWERPAQAGITRPSLWDEPPREAPSPTGEVSSATIKIEGFPYPLYNPNPASQANRPDFRRPFSDGFGLGGRGGGGWGGQGGAATSDLLATSLPGSGGMFMNPFNNYNHIPIQSQQQQQQQQQQQDQRQAFFQPFNYDINSIPSAPSLPQSAPSAPTPIDDRSRSISRGSIGKAKPARSRSGRKGSMTDVKPAVGPRARTASNRAMSYSHPDGRPGLNLDTHLEHQRTNSVSPPDYSFGIAPSWNGSGSLQSMQSFGTTLDSAILDSPTSPQSAFPISLGEAPPGEAEEMKKQRKKELHNLVEKKRREHINTNIDTLAGMLPQHYLHLDEGLQEMEPELEEELGSPKSKKKHRRTSMAKPKDVSVCKGRVLAHTVQYVHELVQTNALQANRIEQLERLITSGTYNIPNSYIPQMPQPVFDPIGLEPLQPSPDPDPFGQDWSNFNQAVFDSSPPEFIDNSSGSGSGSMMLDTSGSSNGGGGGGRVRQDSQMGLQMSMGGMGLEGETPEGGQGQSALSW